MHMALGFGVWGAALDAMGDPLGHTLSRAANLVLNLTMSSPTVADGGLWGE
jgi:hypothetical protein